MLRKILKKGTVAAIALFAVVSLISCGNPSGSSDSGDNKGKDKTEQTPNKDNQQTNNQQTDNQQTDIIKPVNTSVKEKEAVTTSGALTQAPEISKNALISFADSTGGKYEFTCLTVPDELSSRAAETSSNLGGTWKYSKNQKVLYTGNFKGNVEIPSIPSETSEVNLSALTLTVEKTARADGTLKNVVEKKDFELKLDTKNGKFEAIIPSVSYGKTSISVWSFTNEVPSLIEKYYATHQDNDALTDFKFNTTIISTSNGQYTPALNEALEKGEVDIYSTELAFTLAYTRGAESKYAAPYKDFGIDIDKKVKDAELAKYTIDLGSNEDGDIVGLGYQATGGCFIYNRTVAKKVFGTDDPKTISKAIGGSTGKWNAFWDAASKCAEKKVSILSGYNDLWTALKYSADKGWVDEEEEKIYIDPTREAFFDYCKNMKDNGWTNGTTSWTQAWKMDMGEQGDKPVLGFFGPTWMINFTMDDYCGDTKGDWAVCDAPVKFYWGGTWIHATKTAAQDNAKKAVIKDLLEWLTLDTSEDGLLYQWANGTFQWVWGQGERPDVNFKDTVASAVVMRNSDGTLVSLGGQNMFDYFADSGNGTNGNILTVLGIEEDIDKFWLEALKEYLSGTKDKETAIADFKETIENKFGVAAE